VTGQRPRSHGDIREDLAVAAGVSVLGVMSDAENQILATLAAAVHDIAAGRKIRSMVQRQMRAHMTEVMDAAHARTGPILSGIARAVRASAERVILADLPPGLGSRAAAAVHGVPLARTWRALPPLLRTAGFNVIAAADDEFTAASAQIRDIPPQNRLPAVQQTLNAAAEPGLPAFTDGARTWPLPSWAQMAVRTAASRLHLNLYLQAIAPQGFDLVVVYGLTGMPPCSKCRPWLGAVLSISGNAAAGAAVAAVTADGISHQATVAGTVDGAIAAGLFHPQCRHGMVPFTDGASFLPMTGTAPDLNPPDGSDEQRYALEQEIRAVQRAIRTGRRMAAVAVTPKAHGDAQRNLALLGRRLASLTGHTPPGSAF